MAAQTQWRYSPAGPTGLDYAGVAVAARACRADLSSPRVLRLLQALEFAALDRLKGPA